MNARIHTHDLRPGDVVVLDFSGVRCQVIEVPSVWVARSAWVRAEHAKGAPKFQVWAMVLDDLGRLPAPAFDAFRKLVADDGGRWLLVDFDGGVSTWEVERP